MDTTLGKLRPGTRAVVISLSGQGSPRRLAEMGLTPGTPVVVERSAPFGDPVVVSLRGYELTLRRREADAVIVKRT